MSEPVTGPVTGPDYTDYTDYTDHTGYQGYEPEPPARTVKITHLVFGVVFLGIVALWALGTRGDISADDVPVLIPAVLIGAGVVGLVAAALTPLLRRRRGRGQSRRGGADWAGHGAEAAQTEAARDAEAAQTTPARDAEAAQTERVDAAEPADAGGFEARKLAPQPPAGDTMPAASADGTAVEEGRQDPSRNPDHPDRTAVEEGRQGPSRNPDHPDDPTEEIR